MAGPSECSPGGRGAPLSIGRYKTVEPYTSSNQSINPTPQGLVEGLAAHLGGVGADLVAEELAAVHRGLGLGAGQQVLGDEDQVFLRLPQGQHGGDDGGDEACGIQAAPQVNARKGSV